MILDDFEDVAAGRAVASAGVQAGSRRRRRRRPALRIDFDFGARRATSSRGATLPLELPGELRLRASSVRGEAPPNNSSSSSSTRPATTSGGAPARLRVPRRLAALRIRKRRRVRLGPAADARAARRSPSIEIAIAAGSGAARARSWIDDLTLEERAAARARDAVPPTVTASSAGRARRRARLDGDPRPTGGAARSREQWLLLDFGEPREYGGLAIDWDAGDSAIALRRRGLDDGEHWRARTRARPAHGGRDSYYLPDGESRFVRLEPRASSRGQDVRSPSSSCSRSRSRRRRTSSSPAIAAEAPRGTYPKYFAGEQTYWTVVGVDGDDARGAAQRGGHARGRARASFSIEPFLLPRRQAGHLGRRRPTQHARRRLPADPVGALARTAARARRRRRSPPGRPRRRRRSRATASRTGRGTRSASTLFLALRPFQVDPAAAVAQHGGRRRARSDALDCDGRGAAVNGEPRLSCADARRAGASTAGGRAGRSTGCASRRRCPRRRSVADPVGFASGVLAVRPDARAGRGARRSRCRCPSTARRWRPARRPTSTRAPRRARRALARAPRTASRSAAAPRSRTIARTLRTALGYILINRDGPAIQPGLAHLRALVDPRRRAHVVRAAAAGPRRGRRDFLALVRAVPVRERQGAVLRRPPRRRPGARARQRRRVRSTRSPTSTATRATRRWRASCGRTCARAVDYWTRCARATRTPANRARRDAPYFGLLPESISHEGYSASPCTPTGTTSSRCAASQTRSSSRGARPRRRRGAASPRCATSSARPARVDRRRHEAPRARLAAGRGRARRLRPDLDRRSRSAPAACWRPLPPTRSCAHLRALLARRRATRRERRHGMGRLHALRAAQRRRARAPRRARARARGAAPSSIATGARPAGTSGPRSCCAMRASRASSATCRTPGSRSDFIRSVLDLFAYEHEGERSLVLAAGVPMAWLDGPGLTLQDLRTPYGHLSWNGRRRHEQWARGRRDRRPASPHAATGRHRASRTVAQGVAGLDRWRRDFGRGRRDPLGANARARSHRAPLATSVGFRRRARPSACWCRRDSPSARRR